MCFIHQNFAKILNNGINGFLSVPVFFLNNSFPLKTLFQRNKILSEINWEIKQSKFHPNFAFRKLVKE